METEFVSVFQSFGFPTALSVVLLTAFGWLGKKMLNNMKENNEESKRLRDQYIQYLQQNHIDLTAAVMESATAMKENAQALNRFSMVLEKIETIIHNKKD
ncbi:MAG: hypothetical protein K5685_06520 [Bacteroidales bacterium]|nr:hypothetical protein [Bacteroidales bacterium]